MNLELTLGFLKKLKKNNDREWFKKNKSLYKDALTEFETFVEELIKKITDFDPEVITTSVKQSTFRIYRDTRFSNDKTPYKTQFGAYIAPDGRKSGNAGYYIHIEPGGCFAAGGLYRPPTKVLNPIRKAISNDLQKFLKIINKKDFVQKFDSITDTEKLKTAPRGFKVEDDAIEYLKLKNLIAVSEIKDRILTSEDPADKVVDYFETLAEFVGFLRTAGK